MSPTTHPAENRRLTSAGVGRKTSTGRVSASVTNEVIPDERLVP